MSGTPMSEYDELHENLAELYRRLIFLSLRCSVIKDKLNDAQTSRIQFKLSQIESMALQIGFELTESTMAKQGYSLSTIPSSADWHD